MDFVLDAWALLAWLNDEEPAVGEVDSLLEHSEKGKVGLGINLINAGEVYYIIRKHSSSEKAFTFKDRLPTLPVRCLSSSDAIIWRGAELKSQFPISYADAIAASTSLANRAELVTGDSDFRDLEDALSLNVKWLDAHLE